MPIQKYHPMHVLRQSDGADKYYIDWFSDPKLIKIVKCKLTTLCGEPRVTAYLVKNIHIQNSKLVRFYFLGKILHGNLAIDNENFVCHHCYC